METVATRAHGPRLPLREADEPYRRRGSGASPRCGGSRGSRCCRSRSIEGREGRCAEGSQGSREARQAVTAQEEKKVGGEFGTENTSLRLQAWLQQSLEVPLVCEEGLRRPAA